MILQRYNETIRYMVWGLIVILMTALLIWFVQSNSTLLIRPYFTFAYMLFLPGRAWIRVLRLRYPIMSFVYSIPLSLALTVLVAQFVLYTGIYTIENGVRVLAAVTCIGLIVDGIVLLITLNQAAKSAGVPVEKDSMSLE